MEPWTPDERRWVQSQTPPRSQRPLAVTLIAIFQFAKGGFLFVLTALAWIDPARFPDLRLAMRIAIYIAARSNPPAFLLPLVAIYSATIGWGLWRLKKWARNILAATCGLSVALWVRYFLFNLAFQDHVLDAQQRQAVYMLMFLDALVFIYLALYDGVPQAFGVKD